MRTLQLFAALAVAPILALAQDPPVPAPGQAAIDRLQTVLPPEIAEQVIQLVTDATNRGLPGQSVALRALEGVARTRSGEAALAAARELVESLAASRDALQASGATADASEIVAGATAMQLGVSGEDVSALASHAPSGRTLAVPLAVLGALVNRGLPSDDALAAVLARLEAGAGDAHLVEMPGAAGQLLANGRSASEVGLALASGAAGFGVPPAGVPGGVPTNIGIPQPPVPTPPSPPQPPAPPRP
jgi:hypothetical protein